MTDQVTKSLFLTFCSVAVGRGGQGAVYLVRHMLNGEALGLYACKKGEARRPSLSLLLLPATTVNVRAPPT